MSTEPLLQSDPPPTSSGVIYEDVFVPMTNKQQATWELHAGTKPRVVGNKKHFHPILAASRFVLEREACERLSALDNVDVILDVGACAKRTFQYLGDRGRYLVPILQPGDVARRRECPSAALNWMCDHKLEECTCHFDELGRARSPTALLFVHSAYYIAPQRMWELVKDDNVKSTLVVGHHFAEPYGGFVDECTWEMEGKNLIMRVNGQTETPYVHDLLPWLSGWRGPNGEALVGNVLRSIGNFTFLWEVEAVIMSTPIPRGLDTITVDDSFLGPVQFSSDQRGSIQSNAMTKSFSLDLDRIERAGPVLYTTDFTSRVVVTVPVAMIAMAANRCAGRARTPELWNDVCNVVRRHMLASRVPASKAAEAAIVAAALGMVKNLHNEIDVLYTMHSRFGVLYGPMDNLVKFTIPKVYSCFRMFCWLSVPVIISSLVSIAVLHLLSVRHESVWDLFVVLTMLVLLGLILCCLWCCHTTVRSVERERVSTWASEFAADRVATLPTPIIVPKDLRALPGSRNYAPPRDVDEHAKVALLPEPIKNEGKVIPRSFLVGLAPDDVGVNVLEPTQDGDLSMVTHRFTIPAKPYDDYVVDAAARCMEEIFKSINPSLNFSESAFDMWIKAQRGKFPESVIGQWIDLYHSLLGSEWYPPNRTRAFMKMEKSKFLTVEGQTPIKPRAIAPPSDIHKVILGPPVAQLYARARRVFSPGKGRVIYASGCTTDALGEPFDEFLDRVPDAFGVWIDGKNYDATLGFVQQRAYLRSLCNAGFTPALIKLLLENECKGTTTNGLGFSGETWIPYNVEILQDLKKYNISYRIVSGRVLENGVVDPVTYLVITRLQMWSGRMDTNLCDTIVLMSVVGSWLVEQKISDYLLYLCGDDMFLLTPYFDTSLYDSLTNWYKGFGLDPDGGFGQQRHQWEFCSKLFWKGVVQGRERTVLGPKPGRALARFGYSVALPREQNIAAAALGLLNDANHVPLLSHVASRTNQICKEKKLRIKNGHREFELHASMRFECSDFNYTMLHDRYGVTREQVEEFAAVMSTVPGIPAFYHWPPAAAMALIDE